MAESNERRVKRQQFLPSNDQVEETFLFLPYARLKCSYQLGHGSIGPASRLLSDYPSLPDIIPALQACTLDGKSILDPVVLATRRNHAKFMREFQCLKYLRAETTHQILDSEIFGNVIPFRTFDEDGKKWIAIDNNTVASPVSTIQHMRIPQFPTDYKLWDRDWLENFDPFISEASSDHLYRALTRCLDDASDKEMRRERSRIIVSLSLYNQAALGYPAYQDFATTKIALLAAALEALLNLPTMSTTATFEHAVTMLLGGSTTLLRRWCDEFYRYRSALMHGDVAWTQDEQTFGPSGRDGPGHSDIASTVFGSCLKTKLFLLGLYPEYQRQSVDFQEWTRLETQVYFRDVPAHSEAESDSGGEIDANHDCS